MNIVVSTTRTLPQIKPQEVIGHIKQHFMTTGPLTDFVKYCIKSWVLPELRPDNMLLGGLHPTAAHDH